MLVRGRMEHHLGLIAFENVVHPRHVEHVAHDRNDRIPIPRIDQFLLDLEQMTFGLLDQQKHPRTERRDLAAEFAPDAPPRSGHQHRTIAQYRADVFGFKFDRIAPEQILNGERSELAYFDLAGGKLLERGHGFKGEVDALENLDHLTHAFGGGRGHGDDHLVELSVELRLHERLGAADDGNIMHPGFPFPRVVVEEHHRPHAHSRTHGKLSRQRCPHVPSPNNPNPHDPLRGLHFGPRRPTLPKEPTAQPKRGNRQNRQDEIDGNDPARKEQVIRQIHRQDATEYPGHARHGRTNPQSHQ